MQIYFQQSNGVRLISSIIIYKERGNFQTHALPHPFHDKCLLLTPSITVCKLLLKSGKLGVLQQLPTRGVVMMVVLCVCACGGVMGRTLQAMLITHKWPRPVVTATLLMCYHTPWYPVHGCIPAVMGSSWTRVSGRTADAGLKLGRGLRGTP